jgi:hypothetical protein
MGRKRSRKHERRWQQKAGKGAGEDRFADVDALVQADYELLMSLQARKPLAQEELSCSSCREFIEDQVGGRGECLHPGSGILLPWPDTPACPFHTALR